MTAFAQNFNTYPGNVTSPIFTVYDQNGTPINISTVADIQWTAFRTVGAAPVLSKSKVGTTIVLVGGGVTGQFQLNLVAADTAPLSGVYQHQATIIDSLGNPTTVSLGQMTIGQSPSWTYDPTQLGTTIGTGTPLMQVRRLIGDTLTGDQQLWDEEINFALAQRGYIPGTSTSGVIYAAAADCCRDLAAGFSRKVDIVQGELKTNYSNQAKAYMAMAMRYEAIAKSRGGGVPYSGGISITDKQAQVQNSDRTSPSFTIGMTDNLQIGGQQTPETPIMGSTASDELPDF